METFNILLLLLLLILPPNFCTLIALDTWTLMDPSHTTEHVKISEPLRIQHWWHSNSYSIWGNGKFVSLMYKHTPMPPFCYTRMYILVLFPDHFRLPFYYKRRRWSGSYLHIPWYKSADSQIQSDCIKSNEHHMHVQRFAIRMTMNVCR